MLHASRTAWAYSKPTLIEELDYNDTTLGWLDCAFLSAYGIGLFLNGWLGDRLKLKILLSLGVLLTIFAITAFSLIEGAMHFSTLFLGIPLFMLNGIGQSTAFPGFMTILSNWFPAKQRGLIFGIWMANINLGNIIGQQLGKAVIDVFHMDWLFTLIICASVLTVLTLIMMQCLYASPFDAGLTPHGAQQQSFKKLKEGGSVADIDEISGQVPSVPSLDDVSQPRPIGFWEAWKIPGVILYSVVFTCAKASITAMLFWLPSYLKIDVGFQSETAELLACMELGQLFGIIGLGYISDRIGNRSLAITGSLSFAVIIFFALSLIKSSEHVLTYMLLLFLGGLFVGGPSGLIVGALSADLGSKNGNGKVKSTSTITGIIDGCGTVGSAVLQPLIPFFREYSFAVYTVFLVIGTIVTPLASRQAAGKKSSSHFE